MCVCVRERERLDQGEENVYVYVTGPRRRVCVCVLHAWQALFTAVPSVPGTGHAQRKPLEKIYRQMSGWQLPSLVTLVVTFPESLLR